MKQATAHQLAKMKSLLSNTNGKENYELRGVFSYFLQLLNDIDSLSQFQRDFYMKLLHFDYDFDKTYTTKELKELMKSAIDYYTESTYAKSG